MSDASLVASRRRIEAVLATDLEDHLRTRVAEIDRHLENIGPGQMRDHLLELRRKMTDDAEKPAFKAAEQARLQDIATKLQAAAERA